MGTPTILTGLPLQHQSTLDHSLHLGLLFSTPTAIWSPLKFQPVQSSEALVCVVLRVLLGGLAPIQFATVALEHGCPVPSA